MMSGQPSTDSDAIETSSSARSTALPRRSTLRALVETLRPQQWVKNGFIFAALIFSQSLTRWDRCRQVLLAAVVFCLVSSATYVLNDIMDAQKTAIIPSKSFGRSPPAGSAPTPAAIAGAVLGAAAV